MSNDFTFSLLSWVLITQKWAFYDYSSVLAALD